MSRKKQTEKEPMTLTDAFQAVYEYATRESNSDPDLPEFLTSDTKPTTMDRPDAAYARLTTELDITDRQAELLSVILELALSATSCPTPTSVAKRLGITQIKFLSLKPDLERLADKRYIVFNRERLSHSAFIMPNSFVNAISNNRIPTEHDIETNSVPKFCRRLDAIFREFYDDNMDFKTLVAEMDLLLTSSPDCRIVKAWNDNNCPKELCKYEQVLFIFMLSRAVCRNESSFVWEDYARLFYDSDIVSEIAATIESGDLDLFRMGLIEHENCDGLESTESICLTSKAKSEFLGDIKTSARICQADQAFHIIPHDQITRKELFFNDREQTELDRLAGLLQPDNFAQIQLRLQEKGMRRGVACLFYGAPGTGKTASCYNLSAATGRDIWFVDMAQLKSKWVGESEQNLSNLFRSYHKAVRENPDAAPIMVWNEADAIFGRRRKVEHAVDKMENAMQNIILQELEDLEGILIATTNFSLKDGFDPAMERRFLIKVCFDKPEVNTRTKIWRSMFTELAESDARTLAAEYDFSGGLIENINRKATVDYVLSGRQLSLDYLRELCRSEQMSESESRHIIGFS